MFAVSQFPAAPRPAQAFEPSGGIPHFNASAHGQVDCAGQPASPAHDAQVLMQLPTHVL